MEYGVLAEAYARAEATTKRLEMTGIVAGLLDETPLDLVRTVVYLSQGKLAPDFTGIELGLAEKLAIGAIAGVAGVDERTVVKERNRLGDIGSAAEHLLGRKAQATLFRTPLTVDTVHQKLLDIARATGAGSQDKKLKILRLLLSEAEPLEARYLVRTVTGKLRLGVADATVLDALAIMVTDGVVGTITDLDVDQRAARDEAKRLLEQANDVSSDLGFVAETALRPAKEAARRLLNTTDGDLMDQAFEALQAVRLQVGVPLRAMLAERLDTSAAIMEKLGGRAALEYKYDGLRVQIHLAADGTTRIFSRRLEDLTAQFPDVVEHVRGVFQGKEAVVEGEAVAIDPQSGDMLPFQHVSHRRGRKTGIAKRKEGAQSVSYGVEGATARAGDEKLTEIPLAVYLFDLLFLDGEDVKDRPYLERRKALETAFQVGDGHATKGGESLDAAGHVRYAKAEVVESAEDIDRFMKTALEDGAEGIMAKHVDGVYKAGTRGWQWIKFKADYVEGMADTFDLVVVGAFHGQGKRKGVYGAFVMAIHDPDEGRYQTLCRVSTGFEDPHLIEMRERLHDKEQETPPADLVWKGHTPPDVWFEPELVLEVAGAELTRSPVHSACWGRLGPESGIAIRFPRFTHRFRDDKAPEQATTPDEVMAMYERQVKVRGREPPTLDEAEEAEAKAEAEGVEAGA